MLQVLNRRYLCVSAMWNLIMMILTTQPTVLPGDNGGQHNTDMVNAVFALQVEDVIVDGVENAKEAGRHTEEINIVQST